MLEVEGLTRRGYFRDISFSVREGEILGVAGLIGAGRTEVMEALFGVAPRQAGVVKIHGRAGPRSGAPPTPSATGWPS